MSGSTKQSAVVTTPAPTSGENWSAGIHGHALAHDTCPGPEGHTACVV